MTIANIHLFIAQSLSSNFPRQNQRTLLDAIYHATWLGPFNVVNVLAGWINFRLSCLHGTGDGSSQRILNRVGRGVH
jgi:hypothetical protein